MSFFAQRFQGNDAEFSPKPMWFLNGDLTEEELSRQLRDFLAHGVKGVILHPRIGVPRSLPYMSDRFLALIRHAVRECAALGMQVILYDEGMYPSGSANGQVVRENPAYASRCLRLLAEGTSLREGEEVLARVLVRTGDGAFASRLSDEAPAAGETPWLLVTGYSRGTIRGIHPDQDDGQPDAPASADILNPDAVDCFIRLTHERYAGAVGEWFGTTVTSVFCDEPDPLGRNAERDMMPWTPGLEKELHRVGLSLQQLPALWLEVGPQTQVIRSAYQRLIELRLGEAFYARLQDWCHAHGLMLTGHPRKAQDIGVERYFDIPGQDVVWRWVAPENGLSIRGPESTQAACAMSAMLHQGKRRNSSECFGCCGPNGDQWTFHVEDMLFYLNWLFVRGCNLIYPHAFLYAADTPIRYGDRPPDVGPHNYWWPWYGRIAAYITRLCGMLTDVEAEIPVAILCRDSSLPYETAAELQLMHIPYCYLTQDELASASFDGDGILLPSGVRHRVLVVEDDTAAALPSVTQALAAMEAQGVPVVRTSACQTHAQAAERIAEVVKLPFRLSRQDGEQIRLCWRRHGQELLLVAVNEGSEAWHGQITVETPCGCERMDPWTGQILPQPLNGDQLALSLKFRQMLCFVFHLDQPALQAEPPAEPQWQPLTEINQWQAELPSGTRTVTPGDWQQLPGMALYTGSITYHGGFTLDRMPGRLRLSLGEVREAAELWINGQPVDVLLKHPYTCELTGLCHTGSNELTVRVTSGVKSRFDKVPWPAGLLGPVTLEYAD